PRTWGWTVHPGEQHTESLPSPTHVGMDRGPALEVVPAIPEPHARGDGPTNFAEQMGTRVRAPRTWGWTAVTMHAHRQRVPSPTHVGMDRRHLEPPGGLWAEPHARGDGPQSSP